MLPLPAVAHVLVARSAARASSPTGTSRAHSRARRARRTSRRNASAASTQTYGRMPYALDPVVHDVVVEVVEERVDVGGAVGAEVDEVRVLVDVERDERRRVPDRERVLRVADVVEEPRLRPSRRPSTPSRGRRARSPSGRPSSASTEPKSRRTSSPNMPVRIAAVAAEVVEVELVVLDPADREGEIDLQRAELGVDLVRRRQVDARRACRGSRSACRRSPGRACSAPRSSRARSRRARAARASARGRVISSWLYASAMGLLRRCRRFRERRGAYPPGDRTETRRRRDAVRATRRCRTTTTRSSRRSTRRRWRSTTASTTRPTSTNLNAALEGTEWADRPIEEVVDNLDAIPEDKRAAVRNNGGGHANHSLFWQIMEPERRRRPVGRARGAIDDDVRRASTSSRRRSTTRGVKRFGSGWTWLVVDGRALAVVSTPNQDSPLMDGQDADPRHRRLGARLLPQVPEPPPRLPRRLVERRQLGRGRSPLRGAPGAEARQIRPARRRTDVGSVSRMKGDGACASAYRRIALVCSDGELIQRTGDGDRAAFEKLYRRYSRPVFGLALRRLGDRGRAEDAVQETFVSIWRSARTYKPERGPGRAVALRRRAQRDRRPQPRAQRAAGRGARRGRRRAGARRARRAVVDAVAGAPRARAAAGARARGDRARLLERPLAERGRRAPRTSRSVP